MDLAIKARFDAKYTKTDAGCWLWSACVNDAGYGRFTHSGRTHLAHRVAYEIAYPSELQGEILMHTCDVPACVNPSHLVPGTRTENSADAVSKGRQAKGEKHGSAKLLAVEVSQIKRILRTKGKTMRELSRLFQVSNSTIREIKHGRNWGHIT